ncbi:ABC transporter [Marinitoga sp. 1135]|uniref:Spermidine/putrescine import ATP-binding protein PotA n=1 Tax=Marinitoga piezophila (strain DSM 14283 / JCM 11233 / KA3) TaxID=443254 RepID=H2J5B2_MARPK|nr:MULTISPECIES: ABC transporter ATP-binding protein [Marinitoga]AEX84970.1 spermidine/putrescine ABC transporter ATP-binding subunit [Marinitoga piezophila KA3]NUU95201.1 ABC transporter [Marinitoga sp. 1135]NUU97133.1 ABC transporter [Marinitoga sp. 1138]
MSLELKNIYKIFKSEGTETVAVNDFNLKVEEGQLVTFLGPSGCGKTTTLRMIAGFEIPTNGRIFLNGEDITNMPPNKRDISMMFQSYALFPHMTIKENIEFGLKLKKLSRNEITEKVKRIIELTNLEGMENRRPDQISGGQQQRVALARSLVMEPKVLLFDEPLSNLDAKLRESMRSEIRRIQKELNITSIYVTHDQIEAMSISDVIVVMNQGKIMQVGNPLEIYSKPKNKFVADFIGKVNFIEGKVIEKKDDEYVIFNESLNQSFTGIGGEEFSINDSVLIALRPEAINTEPKENNITGIIKKLVFLGAHVEYQVELKDGQTIDIVLFNPIENEIPPIGKEIKLYFSKKAAWIIKNN